MNLNNNPNQASYEGIDGRQYKSIELTRQELESFDLRLSGKIKDGYKVASGGNSEKYPGGSLKHQYPFFKSLGLDIGIFFKGTLNIDIAPSQIEIIQPNFEFKEVYWRPEPYSAKPEDFKFLECAVQFGEQAFKGLIHRPDPKGKISSFHPGNLVEVMAPFIQNLSPGKEITLCLKSSQVTAS